MVQLLPELNEGGVERGVVELNRELVRRGYISTVICARGKLCDAIRNDGGQVCLLDVCGKNPLTVPSRSRALRLLLTELNPDILHTRSRVPGWLVHFANNNPRRHVVSTVHGYNSVSKYSKIMTAGDRVICVSKGIRDYVQKHYGVSNNRTRVVYRGVDMQAFNPDNLDQMHLARIKKNLPDSGKRIIAAVGRITELKGYDILIEAANQLGKSRDDFEVVIIGGVREDKQAYASILQLEAADAKAPIHFFGSESHMPELYASIDLLVSSSTKPESFGRTLVEAMAMGLPVIAPNHGGATEIVTEPIRGRLFTPGDATALADALQQQLDAPKADPNALRQIVENEFSLDTMVNQITAVYDELS